MALFVTGRELVDRVHADQSSALDTQRFLDVCKLVLQAVDKLGTGFMLVKSDVGGNIDRLSRRASTDAPRYDPDLFAMIRDEVADGVERDSSSCTNGLLWLKRAMQFVVALLQMLVDDSTIALSAAASDAYYATLQQYHGWIVTGTFTLALKLVPTRMAHEGPEFLPNLTSAFVHLGHSQTLETKEFVDACASVLPIFNSLGSVFLIAKSEFSTKRDSIIAVMGRLPQLRDIVEEGKVKGTITVKNSPARNLHRLMNSILFISIIFLNLDAGQSMKEAVSNAYDRSLSLMHTWVVRTGIKAGMMALPSRDDFLASIGETEESARKHVRGFVNAAGRVVKGIDELYQGVDMPRSDFTFSWWS